MDYFGAGHSGSRSSSPPAGKVPETSVKRGGGGIGGPGNGAGGRASGGAMVHGKERANKKSLRDAVADERARGGTVSVWCSVSPLFVDRTLCIPDMQNV